MRLKAIWWKLALAVVFAIIALYQSSVNILLTFFDIAIATALIAWCFFPQYKTKEDVADEANQSEKGATFVTLTEKQDLVSENCRLAAENKELQKRIETLTQRNAILSVKYNEIRQHNENEIQKAKETSAARLKAFRNEAPVLDIYVVLDLETTGLNPSFDEITEIAAVKYINGGEAGKFVTLVNPKCAIPQKIVDLTGITDNDVADAPTIEETLPLLAEFLGDAPIVAHNAAFDMSFLDSAFKKIGQSFNNRCFDTQSLAQRAFPGLSSYKLERLKHTLSLGDMKSHRALTDVYMTAALFVKCRATLPDVRPVDWRTLRGASQAKPAGRRRDRESKNVSNYFPTVDYINPNGALYGKLVVFTGSLSLSRDEAMQLAVNAGAIVKGGISMKVDYLVVGKQDLSVVGTDGMSGKEEKAHKYNDEGKANIKFINEAEFLRLAKNVRSGGLI